MAVQLWLYVWKDWALSSSGLSSRVSSQHNDLRVSIEWQQKLSSFLMFRIKSYKPISVHSMGGKHAQDLTTFKERKNRLSTLMGCEGILQSKYSVTSVLSTFCYLMDYHRSTRILCSWNFPGKNSGMGCHFLLQEIFLTQGLNLGLLHCRQILYPLSHQGKKSTQILMDIYLAIESET